MTSYVRANWDRLGNGARPPGRISCFLRTPRFRASSHVLFFLFADEARTPSLVAKVPRLADQCEFLDREAANLAAVHGLRPGGWASIPRVLAYEEHAGTRFLLETMVSGQTMGPPTVRARPEGCIRAVTGWLTELHGRGSPRRVPLSSLADRDLEPLDALEPWSPESVLARETRRLLAPIGGREVPLVFEHGDLSSPNILLGTENDVGVVDWELAAPEGAPAADLFFFLTYVAFARSRADTAPRCDRAFRNAFFGSGAWAWRWTAPYRERLGLDAEVTRGLFLLTWARYVATTLRRLDVRSACPATGETDVTRWLRNNRYHRLWRTAIDHWDEVRP